MLGLGMNVAAGVGYPEREGRGRKGEFPLELD